MSLAAQRWANLMPIRRRATHVPSCREAGLSNPLDETISAMKPVVASVTVQKPRADVYDFLDVLANHESFTDHMLADWQLSGPERGVGASARFRFKKPGRADWMDLTVTAADPPRGTTEETVSAHGRRRTRGTYRLDELPGGGTRIAFELEWLAVPRL